MHTQQLVIGLPAAGKTTFLAALWHVLDAARVPGALRIAEVHGDQSYLNRIRDAWGGCEPLERTRRGQEAVVRMRLVAPGEGVTELVVPDPSGESFGDMWELGRCTAEYVDMGRGAGGILLFINPNTVARGQPIPAERPAGDLGPPPPWEPRLAGTQVQLVELLQMLRRPPFVRGRCPVAVLVSAWDCLADSGLTPEAWLQDMLPLLWQYLRTNAEVFPSRVYGVSAQGGDLETDRAALLAVPEAWERVRITGAECHRHDLSAPIRWIMLATGQC